LIRLLYHIPCKIATEKQRQKEDVFHKYFFAKRNVVMRRKFAQKNQKKLAFFVIVCYTIVENREMCLFDEKMSTFDVRQMFFHTLPENVYTKK